jgi:hypothetical protein
MQQMVVWFENLGFSSDRLQRAGFIAEVNAVWRNFLLSRYLAKS